jgi:hypothetical protein
MGFAEPVDVASVEASAPAEVAGRTTVKPDGTMVIDILVPPPCDAAAAEPDEIVVCAPDPDAQRLPGADGTFTEGGFKPEVQLAPNATARVRGESAPESGADRAMVDVIDRF